MNLRRSIGSAVLLVTIVAVAGTLAAWKYTSMQRANAASAHQPEPMEVVTVAVARQVEHRQATTSIGTVLALRSITPGQVVDAGAMLVALDVSVEEAELKAQEAQAALAETTLDRMQRARQTRAVSEMEVDRARAERDVALAQIARTRAIIARKTIRAPFRGRVGLADVHPGQYLNEGSALTTLQGVDDAVHVDFTVAQQVAATLRVGHRVEVFGNGDATPTPARIVAVDARIEPTTRTAIVRARVEKAAAPEPGGSVRVRVAFGSPSRAVAVPVSALRKGPGGDHVFVVEPDGEGKLRARVRPVESGAMLGDDVVVVAGLGAGEQVAAAGSFKLRDAALVAVAGGAAIERVQGDATGAR